MEKEVRNNDVDFRMCRINSALLCALKMDGNKDDSEMCFNLAIRFIKEGEKEKALKYLLKAQRLYPSQKIKGLNVILYSLRDVNFGKRCITLYCFVDLIETLETMTNGKKDENNEESQPKNDENSRPKTEDNVNGEPTLNHRRKSSASFDSNSNANSKTSAEYSQDQVEAVKKIKKCKDYYEILGVTKEATDSDLKKQYRKLALQFHPDKNKAPGASEAFKAIGNAFAVLSDPQKRKQYDLYGKDEPQRATRHRNTFYSDDGYYYDYSRGFEGDISAEEIFNMFFGGGFPSGSVYVRRNGRFQQAQYRNGENQQQNEPSGYNVLLQMMPVLVLLCLSLMSSFFVSEPPYSLSRTQ
ncbi:dnaJ subfamily B member 12-like protein [Leptotrombidium deliense]|uniref:DnaJ subfamily B member 12-like protein n=1 Tax=Leptotrombidium deliense TaxID=299467 RepID=A0A443SE36_9ACAR|nr:dnaJ subfamily B member 12-like protein [Leptotrombidium deliense]